MISLPTPTPLQLRWQAAQFGLFCHFGINTFYNREWSAGQLDPAGFDPKHFDAAQWVDIAQRAGMKYLILTAKHHDGFCLWPTQTTEYSIRHSPRQIDIVSEVSKACAVAGLHFGLYLSPWDRNSPVYDDKVAYDRFYIAQMTELCTRYGELFEVWLDGAGSEGREYDWDGIMDVVERHQPNAMIFNMGRPTIRWIGNEDGLAADPCYYAVSQTAVSAFTNSTEQLHDEKVYLPPESDVAIRQHWFWQDDDLETLKTPEHLLGIYYRSIGNGANLLLNLGPNRDGLLDEHDVANLLAMKSEVNSRFSQPQTTQITAVDGGFMAEFEQEASFDHLVLNEKLDEGQRINGYRVLDADSGREVARGVTIGAQKWNVFERTRARRLKIKLGSNSAPYATLQGVTAFLTGHETLPEWEPNSIILRGAQRPTSAMPSSQSGVRLKIS
jgi:alpha-L-fucosidase